MFGKRAGCSIPLQSDVINLWSRCLQHQLKLGSFLFTFSSGSKFSIGWRENLFMYILNLCYSYNIDSGRSYMQITTPERSKNDAKTNDRFLIIFARFICF